MIDLTTIQTFEVLPPLAVLQEQNLFLITRNKDLKAWLIGSAIVLGIGIVILYKIESNRTAKTQDV